MQPTLDLDLLRYPIGKMKWPTAFDKDQTQHWVNEIEALPPHFHKALKGLDDDQLDTPYRDGGWTLRQVAHHVPDSHINAYCRFKLALTEDTPTIKPYLEDRWAALYDSTMLDVETSLQMLEALHKRWVLLMNGMTAEDWQRNFFHPDQKRNVPLYQLAALYAWHGKHHTAHITTLRHTKGW